MCHYRVKLGDINNQANIVLLKSDIYHYFNDQWLVIVPKLAILPSHQYITYLISQDAAEL
jgi:hypothetical protein